MNTVKCSAIVTQVCIIVIGESLYSNCSVCQNYYRPFTLCYTRKKSVLFLIILIQNLIFNKNVYEKISTCLFIVFVTVFLVSYRNSCIPMLFLSQCVERCFLLIDWFPHKDRMHGQFCRFAKICTIVWIVCALSKNRKTNVFLDEKEYFHLKFFFKNIINQLKLIFYL